MAGNEKEVAKYLVQNKGKITLKHLGAVKSIAVPSTGEAESVEIKDVSEVDEYLSTEDSRKKADIYINNKGASIKQSGSSFLYNRLQRANIIEVFTLLGFKDPESILTRLDKEVLDFHSGELERRNRPWKDFFTEEEFKALVKYLMVQGSPNVGFSSHGAEFILEAPTNGITEKNINVYTFDEYFEQYKNKIKIAIRRQWVGQDSNSEHGRALGLVKKIENAPWVFNGAVGTPRNGWKDSYPMGKRKTVYFLMIEKEA